MPSFASFEMPSGTLLARSIAVAAAIVLTVALRWLRSRGARRLEVRAARTPNVWDDALVGAIRATRTWFLLLVSLRLVAPWLELGRWSATLHAATLAGGFVQLGLWADLAVRHLVVHLFAPRERTEPPADAASRSNAALRVLGRALVWSVVALLCLQNLGIDITPLVAGLGVGGIAVALAVQNILGDLFAAFTILLDRPFAVGDFIVVGNESGTVEQIGIKTTRLRSLAGEQIVVGNNDLLGSRIHNYKRMRERRVIFSLGVTYETPLDRLEAIPAIVEQIIEGQANTRFERAHLKKLGDFAIEYEIVYTLLEPDYVTYLDTHQRVLLEICRRFEEHGVAFAYPTQTVQLRGQVRTVASADA